MRIERLHRALAVAVSLDLITLARERRGVIFAKGRLVLDDRNLLSHGGIIADRPHPGAYAGTSERAHHYSPQFARKSPRSAWVAGRNWPRYYVYPTRRLPC